jgi:alpha-tubulin suppressor-like RCC1 family protein
LSFSAITTVNVHTCGLTSAGAAYCWGSNLSGQLGDGSTMGSVIPLAISGGLTFSGLAAGRLHTCGITSAGAAYCWGDNGTGQLGDGEGGPFMQSSIPVAVSGALSFSALAPGSLHTCGLTSAGAAYCWGANGSGQLGIGSTSNSSVPVAVSGGLDFSALASGSHHTCGVTSAGVYCWGRNEFGQLGNGTTENSTVPVAVSLPQGATVVEASLGVPRSAAAHGARKQWFYHAGLAR